MVEDVNLFHTIVRSNGFMFVLHNSSFYEILLSKLSWDCKKAHSAYD